MKYAIEKEGNAVVIQLKASLEGGPDTFQIKDDIKDHLANGERKFVLDMSSAGFVNSTGIGVVVGILSSVKDSEGALKLSGVSDRARRAFVVTGVWQLFDAYDTLADAKAAFSA